MSAPIFLSSQRLVYKPLSMAYCNETYVGWLNDPEVNKYLEIFEPYTMDMLRSYLESVDRNSQMLFWAIHVRDSGKHIGNIKIDPINRYHGYGEYGIMMGDRQEWGKGYAREASEAVIEHCFKNEKLRKINLGVVEENQAAVQLYKKLGFQTEGVYRKHGLYDGHYCNLLRMALFNPEAEA